MSYAIFSLIPESHLKDVLGNLQEYTGLSIQLIAPNGELIMSFGKNTDYCAKLQHNVLPENACLLLHADAGRKSQEIGEAYVFSCKANLNHIAFPLIDGKDLLGSIILGPFLMDEPDSTIVSTVAIEYNLSPAFSLELYDTLTGLQIIHPQQVNQLRKLLDHLLSTLMPGAQAVLMSKQQQLYQQSRINETIQKYKEQANSSDLRFIYEKEKELLAKVRSGDIPSAKGLLNELIGHTLFSNGGVLEAVRARAVELTTLLSRVAMDGGADPESIYSLNGKFVSILNSETSFEDVCSTLQEVVESFMSSAFFGYDKGNPYIRKALRFMSDNYNQRLDVKLVATHIGLSPSYFSSLFNETLGCSFTDKLNTIRVEESKRLLLSTKYELADIAIAMGFPDQSYYCKVFKKITGISPGKFRNQIQ